MAEQKEKLKMIKMKGYKGYVWEGFKKIAQEYDKVKWNGSDDSKSKAKEIIETPFKKTYKF